MSKRIRQKDLSQALSSLFQNYGFHYFRCICCHLVVMEFGTNIAEGLPQYIRQHPAVLEAYLGGIDA